MLSERKDPLSARGKKMHRSFASLRMTMPASLRMTMPASLRMTMPASLRTTTFCFAYDDNAWSKGGGLVFSLKSFLRAKVPRA